MTHFLNEQIKMLQQMQENAQNEVSELMTKQPKGRFKDVMSECLAKIQNGEMKLSDLPNLMKLVRKEAEKERNANSNNNTPR